VGVLSHDKHSAPEPWGRIFREVEEKLRKPWSTSDRQELFTEPYMSTLIDRMKEGDLYIVLRPTLSEWDIAAASLILRHAGGICLAPQGGTHTFRKENPKVERGVLAAADYNLLRVSRHVLRRLS